LESLDINPYFPIRDQNFSIDLIDFKRIQHSATQGGIKVAYNQKAAHYIKTEGFYKKIGHPAFRMEM